MVFYGLDKLAKQSRGQAADTGDDRADGSGRDTGILPDRATTPAVFRVHMASFGVYNVLIGYLLVAGERGTPRRLLFFTIAMALHFLVADAGLEEDHKHRYRRTGRWILAAAIGVGVTTGHLLSVPAAVLAVLLAFLAGGVILNVLKEEVPSERQSRFWAFAAGMAGYTVLLLL